MDDDSTTNDNNDDKSIYDETELRAKSSIKNHFLDLTDLIDSGFSLVEVADKALADEIDVVQDGLRWKSGGTRHTKATIEHLQEC